MGDKISIKNNMFSPLVINLPIKHRSGGQVEAPNSARRINIPPGGVEFADKELFNLMLKGNRTLNGLITTGRIEVKNFEQAAGAPIRADNSDAVKPADLSDPNKAPDANPAKVDHGIKSIENVQITPTADDGPTQAGIGQVASPNPSE